MVFFIDFYYKIWYTFFGDTVKYPSGLNKEYNKKIKYGKRGMNLESDINFSNEYYLFNDIALIYKKPTPITVLKTENKKISSAYYKEKSTLDYVGIYNGKYIEFDAKETKQNYLPLSNIHEHQIKHIKKIISHGGISFLIIYINEEYYLLKGEFLIKFINENNRKSIPYNYIKEYGKNIKYNYLKGLSYLEELWKELKLK